MRRIELCDKQKIENIRESCAHELSSHAFVNLFLWQEQMKLTVEIREDAFFVRAGEETENTFFYPCGSEAAQLAFTGRHLGEDGFKMVYLRNQDKEFLEQHFPGRFSFTQVEASCEYIFSREELELLKGRGLLTYAIR